MQTKKITPLAKISASRQVSDFDRKSLKRIVFNTIDASYPVGILAVAWAACRLSPPDLAAFAVAPITSSLGLPRRASASRPSAALICVISLRTRLGRRGPDRSDEGFDLGYVVRHSETYPGGQCRNQHDHDHPSGRDLSPFVSGEGEPAEMIRLALRGRGMAVLRGREGTVCLSGVVCAGRRVAAPMESMRRRFRARMC
jgi:hypothetical protein